MGRGKERIVEETGGRRIGESDEQFMNRRKAIQNLRKQMRTIEDVDKLVALTRAGNVLPDGFDSYEDLETQPE